MESNHDKALRIMTGVDAVVTNDHFVYSSWRHGSAFIRKHRIYPYTRRIANLCGMIAEQFVSETVEVVVAPAIGGIILSQRVADRLTAIYGYEVLAVFAEKEGDNLVFARGYDKLLKGKRVLVVEDVLTTGRTARKLVRITRSAGGIVVGVGALCNRGGVTAESLDAPELYSLINITLEDYNASECPLCKSGKPINTEVGHGKEFLRSRGPSPESD